MLEMTWFLQSWTLRHRRNTGLNDLLKVRYVSSFDPKKWVLVTQLCPTLCGLWPSSPCPWTVHGILQAGVLEMVVIPLSRVFSQPRNWALVSWLAHRFFTISATREARTICQNHRQKHLNMQLLENHFRQTESGPEVGGIQGQLDGLMSDRNQWSCPPTCSLPDCLLSALSLSLFPGYVKEKDRHRVISVSFIKPLDISLELHSPYLYFGTYNSTLKVSSDPVPWRVMSDKELTSC